MAPRSVSFEGLLGFGRWRLGWRPAAPDSPPRATPFGRGRAQVWCSAEGAALLLLEEEDGAQARGARTLGRLRGHGAAFDPARFAEPSSQRRAEPSPGRSSIALADAGLAAAEIDLLVAAANGLEAARPRRGPGARRRCSAKAWRACRGWRSKRGLGETLGAGGALAAHGGAGGAARGEAPAQPGLVLDPQLPAPAAARGGHARLARSVRAAGARPRSRRRSAAALVLEARAKEGRVSDQHVPLRLVPRFKDQGYDAGIDRPPPRLDRAKNRRPAGRVGAVRARWREAARQHRKPDRRGVGAARRGRVRCTSPAKRRTGSSTCRWPPPKGRWCARYERGMAAITRAGGAQARIYVDENRVSPIFHLADVAAAAEFARALQLDFPADQGGGRGHHPARQAAAPRLPAGRPQDDRRPAVLDRRRARHEHDRQGGRRRLPLHPGDARRRPLPGLLGLHLGETASGVAAARRQRQEGDRRLHPAGRAGARRCCGSARRRWSTSGNTRCSADLTAGSLGYNGHFANGLTALFIATGQDVANVANSAVGVTHFELTPEGDLCASVTLAVADPRHRRRRHRARHQPRMPRDARLLRRRQGAQARRDRGGHPAGRRDLDGRRHRLRRDGGRPRNLRPQRPAEPAAGEPGAGEEKEKP